MVNYVQRARDVRFLIKENGVERGLIKAVERLSEDNEMMRQELAEFARTINTMSNIVADIATVGAKLKNDFEQVRKRFHPDNEDIQ